MSRNRLWLVGLAWLTNADKWPPDIITNTSLGSESEAKRAKEMVTAAAKTTHEFDVLLEKFPLKKAIRIIALISGFQFNCCVNQNNSLGGPLAAEQITNRCTFWVKRAQSSQDDQANKYKQRGLDIEISDEGVLQ